MALYPEVEMPDSFGKRNRDRVKAEKAAARDARRAARNLRQEQRQAGTWEPPAPEGNVLRTGAGMTNAQASTYSPVGGSGMPKPMRVSTSTRNSLVGLGSAGAARKVPSQDLPRFFAADTQACSGGGAST